VVGKSLAWAIRGAALFALDDTRGHRVLLNCAPVLKAGTLEAGFATRCYVSRASVADMLRVLSAQDYILLGRAERSVKAKRRLIFRPPGY
jgi:hypothetical protein